MRQEQSRLDPSDCVIKQGGELLALFLGDRGPQVLDFDQSLADENNLGNFVDPRHPGIADQLRIQGGNAGRVFRISRRSSFPFQEAWCAVEFTNGVDISYEIVPRVECPIELNLLG